VRNPFRSEEDAFRLLLMTIGYFALIVIGAVINTWLGVAVFVALTLGVVYYAFGRSRDEAPSRVTPKLQSGSDETRILVIANETLGGGALNDCIRQKAGGSRANVYVIAPMQTSHLQHITSDDSAGRDDAHARLDASLAQLRAEGFQADGQIGDEDPLTALGDGLRVFGADEIIISTHPEGESHWLERGVVEAARARVAVPITHVIVHGAGDRAEVR
jgi:hypothetical protein